MTQKIIEFDDSSRVPLLFGAHNAHLKHIEGELGISIADRGNTLTFSGDDGNIQDAQDILQKLWKKLEKSDDIGIADIDAEIRFMKHDQKKNGGTPPSKSLDRGKITLKTKKKPITARSPNQEKYLKAMQTHDMVFGLGPAGTGKTYLAVAMAVSKFLEGEVERLIFTRPAVEAGEHLGFLPGDMKEKVDPYLRPIYDALHDMLHWDVMVKKMETGDIEIAPLAFMRGRTLSNAFVILDEAQNTTIGQMKMFLTRMGENTRMVITGDMTQTDLPRDVKSGLRDAVKTLRHIDEVAFCEFENKDVIRHKLVGKIVDAYDARH